jgi:hypothetical protein
VVKSRPEIEEKAYAVVFTTGDVTAEALLGTLKKVSPETTLKGVEADATEAAPKKGCAGCPMKGKCQKAAETQP